MELKGVNLELKEHSHEVQHRPELLSTYSEVMVFEIVHEEKKMGLLYLGPHFLGLLLHKVLGGGDRVAPIKASLPLGKIEAKSLETAFGIFNLSLREGLKRSFPLRDIDFIRLHGPLDEFQFTDHLKAYQYLNETFIFKASPFDHQVGLSVLLDAKVFTEVGK